MIVEQIQAARAIRWRQKANPVLTLEDATEWLQQTGICLFLPRKAQLAVPAPSFVEACLGETTPTPLPAAIHDAASLLQRMVDAGAAIPLNLLGMHAEQPDFLVSPDTFPFIFSLRGDKEWKRAPRTAGAGRVSPLVLEVWRTLERKGALSAAEIQDTLGKELTEAAVLRALYELWGYLRVIPSYEPDASTVWEPVEARFRQAIHSGGGMSQVTALSVLSSLYLQSAVAATSEDVETFLSPLTSRTKVREVIRGLTATRQLMLMPMDGQTMLYVEGSLPEFEEIAVPEPEVAEAPQQPGRTAFDRRPPRPGSARAPRDRQTQSGASSRPAFTRPASPHPTGGRPAFGRPTAGRPLHVGERARVPRPDEYKKFEIPETGEAGSPPPASTELPAVRAERTEIRRSTGAPRESRPAAGGARPRTGRPEWKGAKPGAGSGKPAWKGRPASGDAKPSWKRAGASSDRRPAPSSGGTDRPRDFKPRPPAGSKPFRKPFPDRGERAGSRPAAGGAKPAWKPRAPRSDDKPAWNRDARPSQPRSAPRGGASAGPREFKPRPPAGSKPFAKPYGERSAGAPRTGGAKPAWKDRGKPPVKDRSAKPRWDRPRPPSEGQAAGATGKPREYRPRPAGGRPASGGASRSSRPSGPRAPRTGPGGASLPRSDKPRTFSSKPRSTSGGDSRSGDRRTGAKAGRPPYAGKGKPPARSKPGFAPKKRPE